MTGPRPTLADWLAFDRYPDLTKARWLGGMISVAGTIVVVTLGALTVFRFFMAVSGIDVFEDAEAQSAAIRNNGLVIAAMIGVPFLIWRTSVAQKQVDTAQEALFNDKINAASEDLYAMRQRWDGEQNIWEDDIVRRSAAVLRLEDLTRERPAVAPRIARMLCLYVKGLSKEFPPEVMPEFSEPSEITDWTYQLTVKRPDMEGAVQTLGRLKDIAGVKPREVNINLQCCNLQGHELSNLNFNDANFSGASLQGARFIQTRLQRADLRATDATGALFIHSEMQCTLLNWAKFLSTDFAAAKLQGSYFEQTNFNNGTLFHGTHFRGAAMQYVDFSGILITSQQIEEFFFDCLSKRPGLHKNKSPMTNALGWSEFDPDWRAWQKSIGFDPNDPSTWDGPST